MVKNLSYREKLLELARIYKISEIQNYLRNKKNLTTSQLEHLLKKNKVPIPKDFNVGFFAKNFSKPISKAGRGVSNIYDDTTGGIGRMIKNSGRGVSNMYDGTTGGIGRFFKNIWKMLGNAGLGVLNTIPILGSTVYKFLSNIFVDSFSSFYNPEINEKRANKILYYLSSIVIIAALGIGGVYVFENYDREDVVKKNISEKNIQTNKKIEKSKKKEKEVKKSKELLSKKPDQNATQNRKSTTVPELVLPNLNLKTETVLSLFEDVEYDLKSVRSKKTVKPIYFTQFPKDLDEIKDVKLKKETFIKIVLPLVVAENEKILNDRLKLKKILAKKMTSDKEKNWLRAKLREYKVKKSDFKELQIRMDIIPVSIALAQAAKESGWGTSRFALEGNAIFGQWTWTGQGIEPLNKGKHEGHKILRFPILRASVKAYKNNLNTHKGYKDFREKRFTKRKRNVNVKGLDLTGTLDKYAATGKEYTKKLKQIIIQNDLSDFETVRLTNSVIKKQLDL